MKLGDASVRYERGKKNLLRIYKMVKFPRKILGMISSGIMATIVSQISSQTQEMLSESLHKQLRIFSLNLSM
jgi:hypothetical protein